jgi:hypothetical protein
MANTYKVLGQAAPTSVTATTVYTVPAATSAVISSIVICNRDSTTQTYRLAVRPAGASLTSQHYLCYDMPITAKDTHTLTLGITLATTDVITIYSTAATAAMVINVFGSEVT